MIFWCLSFTAKWVYLAAFTCTRFHRFQRTISKCTERSLRRVHPQWNPWGSRLSPFSLETSFLTAPTSLTGTSPRRTDRNQPLSPSQTLKPSMASRITRPQNFTPLNRALLWEPHSMAERANPICSHHHRLPQIVWPTRRTRCVLCVDSRTQLNPTIFTITRNRWTRTWPATSACSLWWIRWTPSVDIRSARLASITTSTSRACVPWIAPRSSQLRSSNLPSLSGGKVHWPLGTAPVHSSHQMHVHTRNWILFPLLLTKSSSDDRWNAYDDL